MLDVLILLTARPGRPCNPLCPFKPGRPLGPLSPGSPLSPRIPCGPCKERGQIGHLFIYFFKMTLTSQQILFNLLINVIKTCKVLKAMGVLPLSPDLR